VIEFQEFQWFKKFKVCGEGLFDTVNPEWLQAAGFRLHADAD